VFFARQAISQQVAIVTCLLAIVLDDVLGAFLVIEDKQPFAVLHTRMHGTRAGP